MKKILPKQYSITFFCNQNKTEEFLPGNSMCHGLMDVLFGIRVYQQQKMLTKQGTLVCCLYLTDNEAGAKGSETRLRRVSCQ